MLNIDRSKVEIEDTVHWWGSDHKRTPLLVDEALGDGEQLIGLQTLNDRPNYYVIRVDSSWHLSQCRACKDDCPDYLTEHLDEIYEAIEDQFGTPETEEDVEDGEEPERGWPRFDYGNGTCWFSLDPAPYLPEPRS